MNCAALRTISCTIRARSFPTNQLLSRAIFWRARTFNMDQRSRQYSASELYSESIAAVEKLNACDIADALLKLDVPGAGFLAGIGPAPLSMAKKVAAPASTVLFTAKSTKSFPESAASSNPLALINKAFTEPLPNIPSGAIYSDLTQSGTIVVLSQPSGQSCAVMGGIQAVRMKTLGACAVLVDGRVRDLDAVRDLGIPVWSRGTSIVGAGAETKQWAVQVPVQVQHTVVHPGDIILIDPNENGAVCIPLRLVDQVLELVPKLKAADEKVIADVESGSTVQEAFRKHRGK